MALSAQHWSNYLRQLADRLDMSQGGKVSVVSGDTRALREAADFIITGNALERPKDITERLRGVAKSPVISTKDTEVMLEAAHTIENLRMGPAVAKPEKWTTERTRYRDPQPHRGPMYRCVGGPLICTYCGYDQHETGCIRG